MLGAIIGDIVGSAFEFEPTKRKDFPLFSKGCSCTDDTMMTVAVAQALMDTCGNKKNQIKDCLIRAMHYWGNLYPNAGYGGNFKKWLSSNNPVPYNSYGNGSAMRVSACGWLYETIEETLEIAKYTAETTHNHPEGIKGAQATAAAIFLARSGESKDKIKEYIEREFQYNLDFTIADIRPDYHFDVSCQGSVPEALKCFLEGETYEEVIRLAVSLGGDADTQAAISGAIAEAFYGIPNDIREKAEKFIPEPVLIQVNRFYKFIDKGNN